MIKYCTDGEHTYALKDDKVFKLEDGEWGRLDGTVQMFAKFNPELVDTTTPITPLLD